jgi:hypothetical protein
LYLKFLSTTKRIFLQVLDSGSFLSEILGFRQYYLVNQLKFKINEYVCAISVALIDHHHHLVLKGPVHHHQLGDNTCDAIESRAAHGVLVISNKTLKNTPKCKVITIYNMSIKSFSPAIFITKFVKYWIHFNTLKRISKIMKCDKCSRSIALKVRLG